MEEVAETYEIYTVLKYIFISQKPLWKALFELITYCYNVFALPYLIDEFTLPYSFLYELNVCKHPKFIW